MRVAIIPARGGSQRIPKKNIREFRGRPIISYAIRCALESGLFEKVIVTTDTEEIAQVARDCGAETPFLRSAELADHHTPLIPVIRDAIEKAAANATSVCAILPTSPCILAQDLIKASAQLDADPTLGFVFSGTAFPFPIQRAVKLDGQGRVSMFQPEHQLTRSQDLEPSFHDAGQFYFGRKEAWLTHDGIFETSAALMELPSYRVQDIDDEQDWQRAELMHELLEKQHLL